MKKMNLFLCVLVTLLTFHATPLSAIGLRIPFTRGYVNPTKPRPHKSPVLAPTVYIDGNVLTFETPCDGCVLQLVDENDDVVYTTIIPAGATTLALPSDLEGTFELQIIDGEWMFYADIEL